VTTAATTAAPKNITIFLDPGHGGSDPGVVRTYDGVTYEEADINLSVALKAKEELEKRGYTVVMSRETDKKVELTDRPELAKKAGADMFISIHVNSYGDGKTIPIPNDIYGPRMYYTRRAGLSYNALNFATYFAEEFNDILEVKMTDYPDKLAYPNMRLSKVYNDFYDLYNQRAYLAVLGAKTIPSVLIELGFITNDNDLMMLKSKWWQGYVAIAIADAVDAAYEDGVYAK
jgi:N-acetylmuramoyl-L-alanine amidase